MKLAKVGLLGTILVLVTSFAEGYDKDQEEITKDVKIKKKSFKCVFVLASDNSKMILKKCKVKCTPSKPKKQRVSNLELQGQYGLYIISFNVNPSKITKGTLYPPEINTTTQAPNTGPIVLSCELGSSGICTPDIDGNCTKGMTHHCFGHRKSQSQEVECGCLPTLMLEDAIAENRNPLGSCSSSCLCVPSSLLSPCPSKAILITGGSTGQAVASSEVYGGPAGCTAPSLPQPYSYHVTFTTGDGLLATCGGSKCLILDGGQAWVENSSKMGNLLQPVSIANAVTLSAGVYILEGSNSGSQFLPSGASVWKEGPTGPVGAVYHCHVAISQLSFLVIGGGHMVREYDSANPDGPTSSTGWKPIDTWPDLLEDKYFHACALYGDKVVVAGGRSVVTTSFPNKATQILDLTSRSIIQGPDMNTARGSFGLSSIGTEDNMRLLAFGGWYGREVWEEGHDRHNKDVEELNLVNSTWTLLAEDLQERRASFGFLPITEDVLSMICET